MSSRLASADRRFAHLRKELIAVSQTSDTLAADKLAAYLQSLHEQLPLSYVALSIYSRTLGTQTLLSSRGRTPFAPSPAQSVPSYSIARQMAEVLSEDVDDKIMRFSADSDLPQDLAALAQDKDITEFLLQATCTRNGELRSLLVLASDSAAIFSEDDAWLALNELLDVLIFDAVQSSSLGRFVAFAELLQVTSCEADVVTFLSQWLPALLVGPWAPTMEVALAVVSPSKQKFVLYKVADRSITDSGSNMQNAVMRSRSATVQRIASVSKLRANSVGGLPGISEMNVAAHPAAEMFSSISDLITLPEASRPSITVDGSRSKRKKCVFKELDLKGSLMESVTQQSTVISIADVRQHVSEQSNGLIELLFAVDTQPPRSMLLLPLFNSAGVVYGGIYIMSFLMGNLVSVQHDVESLLMIASEIIANAMRAVTPSRRSAQGQRLQGFRKSIHALVTADNGENNCLEAFNDGRNVAALQQMYTGIIGDPGRFLEAPQVCHPEQLRIESVAGAGAFAVVYRGRLDVSDTLVAVKVMPMDASMDEMMLVRNATELAALSKIRHHNVVQIIAQFPDCVMLPIAPGNAAISLRRPTAADASSSDPPRRCCVLVMEFCTYGTLLNALQMDVFKHKNGMPNISSICSVLLEIASALAHIHQHGILHCDLKPQNVLLKADECSPRGFVSKLTDFGLARVVTREQPMLWGDSAGTPSHLAPEIVKIGDQESIKTAKSDIYAFGIVMWEMFMAQQAFWMVDKHAVLTHVVLDRKRLPFPSFANPKYVELCQRCWHADMDKRPSLQSIQSDLKAIMCDYAAQVRGPASPSKRIARPVPTQGAAASSTVAMPGNLPPT